MKAKPSTPTVTLDHLEVECTHCGVQMTAHQGSGQRVKYFRCGSCHRWLSSTYADVLRADARMRTHRAGTGPAPKADFEAVKGRLERWLAALDDQDPYRLLGVSPLDALETIRARYRELAFQRHPDRGGTVDAMRELNLAYERITRHLENRRLQSLGDGRRAERPEFGATVTP